MPPAIAGLACASRLARCCPHHSACARPGYALCPLPQTKTEEEKQALADELRRKTEAEQAAAKQRLDMEAKLSALQEKLLVGGQMLDLAQKQEADLKRAQLELQRQEEERKRLEQEHLREMEEANLMIEEQYATMQEEVEAKTKKLKRCWQKLQAAKSEIRDLTVGRSWAWPAHRRGCGLTQHVSYAGRAPAREGGPPSCAARVAAPAQAQAAPP